MNNSTDDTPRRKGPRRGGPSDPKSRQRPRGERRGPPRSGRLSQEEVEWARDLWRHREPPQEIADQLGVSLGEVEALIANWAQPQDPGQ
jgi:hypothetical protein